MTKDQVRSTEEALKLALEALEYIHEGANNQGPHTGISWRCVAVKAESAITAIKQALLTATPLAAPYVAPQLVQEPADDGFTQALIERDEYHAIADELAEMIAQITGEDIGEHTSANFPWRNALDAAENWLCHSPAAPVQEPVGCMRCATPKKCATWGCNPNTWPSENTTPPNVATPLDETASLAAPDPKDRRSTWVGLTDEEIKAVIAKIDPNEHYLPNSLRQLSLALEAKLKEKNSD